MRAVERLSLSDVFGSKYRFQSVLVYEWLSRKMSGSGEKGMKKVKACFRRVGKVNRKS